MARFYQTKILTCFMKKNIGKPEILSLRRRFLQNASGNILEIGIGSGINLSLYPSSITRITAVDPFVCTLPDAQIKVNLYPESVEKMHFEENTFDTVVSTFSFCSIHNLSKALKEVSRVLKPGGRLIFLEHGKAKNKALQKLQNIANPFFRIFACGCNINRDYKQIVSGEGFKIEHYQEYKGRIFPKFLAGHLHEGVAINEKN